MWSLGSQIQACATEFCYKTMVETGEASVEISVFMFSLFVKLFPRGGLSDGPWRDHV